MDRRASRACVLNTGGGAWAFEGLAEGLAANLGVEVSTSPREYNYLLAADGLPATSPMGTLFIPREAIEMAADKRTLAAVFRAAGVPTPETHLFDEEAAARAFIRANSSREWCLKYPVATGAQGHQLFRADGPIPAGWPTPFVVQEFLRMDTPEVYRAYAAGGTMFGWLARRSRNGSGSPWVAHARGAQWVNEGTLPEAAAASAAAALGATRLIDSFGCADLMRRPDGQWVVIEVGTDGVYSHVDRDLGDPAFEQELAVRIKEAFWRRFATVNARVAESTGSSG